MSVKDINPHSLPTCDNDCTLLGWVEYTGNDGYDTLHISVAPNAYLDDTFKAFCHDEQEIITVDGWLVNLERVSTNA